MKIELDLPPKTVRLLKALKELNGLSAEEMGNLSASILEKGLKEQIATELGLYATKKPGVQNFEKMFESDLSMDLGDEEEIEEEPSGVTEDMIEKDLEISNPRKEAKAEAAPSESYLFGYEDPRATKRKKNLKLRGKVTAFSGSDSEESLY